jgi:NAD(P)-dependent dehydrogenase (short-subunit alcohol dehydrogenase family)
MEGDTSMPDDQFASYPSLKGVPVVISGGASGIGEGIVRAFAAQDSKVGFVDVAVEQGRKLETELRASGHAVRFVQCDITDITAYKQAIVRLEQENGPALALINNAANDQRYPYDKITPEIWEWSIGVNLRHSFFAAQAVAPGMIAAGRGSIVNFGSIAWMINLPNLAPYSASKAAMHGMSRSLAKELGLHSVRVNTVVPGWIMTDKQLTHWVGPKEREVIAQQQAIKGLLHASDIARMVLFLAADDSQMITGQVFTVDGGWAHA